MDVLPDDVPTVLIIPVLPSNIRGRIARRPPDKIEPTAATDIALPRARIACGRVLLF